MVSILKNTVVKNYWISTNEGFTKLDRKELPRVSLLKYFLFCLTIIYLDHLCTASGKLNDLFIQPVTLPLSLSSALTSMHKTHLLQSTMYRDV